jgi:preprotein translocase subunit SecB
MNAPLSQTPYKILRVYLKGASVEVPHMADVAKQALSPDVGVDMQTNAAPAWPGAMECVLRISLHARQAGKNIFILEVSVAGVFELDLTNMEEAHRFVRQVAPSVLFPFARKDLASLAVSAGFQPVLLDHVDFDAMLTQVIKSQRWTRPPAPMRLDVIAAKPSMPAAIAPEPEPKPDWADTAPAPLVEPFSPEPLLEQAQSKKLESRSKKLVAGAMAMLSVAAVVALWTWERTPDVKMAVQTITPDPTPQPLPKPIPEKPVEPPPPLSQATQAAIQISKERLADQPQNWFTLDMGVVPPDTPLTTLNSRADDRPLFVLKSKEGGLRVLSGVFPSQAAADATGLPTAAAVPIGDL